MRDNPGCSVDCREIAMLCFRRCVWLLLVVGFGVCVAGNDVTLLWEDFEGEVHSSVSGLWHVTGDTGVVGVSELGRDNHAAYYGQDDSAAPSYVEESWTGGELSFTTPPINVVGHDAFQIAFDYWREVESFAGGAYDEALVEVKLDSEDWETIWTRSSETPCTSEWVTENNIPAILTDGATTLQLRFVFDSIDDRRNDYVGWLVDNVRIVSARKEGAVPLREADQSDYTNRMPQVVAWAIETHPGTGPFPATRMVCDEEGIEWMVIYICTLTGICRMEREEGNEVLVPYATDRHDVVLMPGGYIIFAKLLSDGEWVRTPPQTLFLR